MRSRLRVTCKIAASIIITILVLYLGRVLALYIINRLLNALQIGSASIVTAPPWAMYIYSRADAVANTVALASGLSVLLYLRLMFKPDKQVMMFSHLLLGALGIVIGVMLVRLLLSIDSIRSKAVIIPDLVDYLSDVLLSLVTAILIRECVTAGIHQCYGEKTAYVMSAITQALMFVLLSGETTVALVLNGLISGALFAMLYVSNGEIYSEVFLCAGFRIGARRIGGFPNVKAFPVSENWFTGGNVGLEASVLMTIVLGLCLSIYLLLIKKWRQNGKKTVVSR